MILCCCQGEMKQPRAAAPLLGESWDVPCLILASCTMPRKPDLRNRSFGSSASSRAPAFPKTFHEHGHASASVTTARRSRTCCRSPPCPEPASRPGTAAGFNTAHPPSSHQPRSLARQPKSSLGWEGTGETHGDVLQGKPW